MKLKKKKGDNEWEEIRDDREKKKKTKNRIKPGTKNEGTCGRKVGNISRDKRKTNSEK